MTDKSAAAAALEPLFGPADVPNRHRVKAKKEGGEKWESPADQHHMGNFLDCMRSRKKPLANIDAGYGHAVATILANMAYRNGVRMEYDAERMEMRKAPAQQGTVTG